MKAKTLPTKSIIAPIMPTLGRAAVIAAAIALFIGQDRATAQRALGIDVYNGDGVVTWSSVKNSGRSFAWVKATEGTYYNDAQLANNQNNGKAAGLVMGSYHYARPDLDAAGTEANFFWSSAAQYTKADGKTLAPQLDFEVFNGAIGSSSYTAWANTWAANVTAFATGQAVTLHPIVYVSSCNACEFNSGITLLPWLANYNGESDETGTPWNVCTSCEVWGAGAWDLWQYSSSVVVPGVPGNSAGHCDVDAFNGASVASLLATTGAHGETNRVGMASTPSGQGYWIVASDGGVFSFGDAQFYGSMGGQHLNAPIVGMAARPQGDGYWLVGSDGGIFTFGNAGFHGSEGGVHLNAPIVAVCSTASGNGYWEVGADGGIFTFGDAPYNGSMGGQHLNAPIVDMARTPGNGYWLVGSDGGIFGFGATFYGSMGGTHLNAPITGIAARPQGDGYWLTGTDGGIFAFGNAGFHGSLGGVTLAQPIVEIAPTPSGNGYWEVGADGGIFSFGDAPFKGGANF